MIGRLRGVLLEKQPPRILLDVNGVGYELDAPMGTFYQLPEPGAEVTLFTHLVVREDAHLLYGFINRQDRELFRSLLRVNGVGAKMALALLSGMSAEQLIHTVQGDDVLSLTRIPGIGKKTAERLLVEMRDRLKTWSDETPLASGVEPATDQTGPGDAIKDAVSALVALGYKPQEASRMVRSVDCKDLPSEQIIRQALQSVASVS
jgi:Holliday junction DNA helicase RuvA